MSVLEPIPGEKFVAVVQKYLASDPNKTWVNTYEFMTGGTAATEDLLTIGENLCRFEQKMHRPEVFIEKCSVRTWTPRNSEPSGDNFVTFAYGQNGTGDALGEMLDLRNVLLVDRNVQVGRKGHIAFRGTLGEADVNAVNGTVTLVNRITLQDQLAAALTHIELFINGDGTEDATLLMISESGLSRPITGFSVNKASIHRRTRVKKRKVDETTPD